MADAPAVLGDRVFIVGDPHRPKWALLDCPCATGHRLTVNLMRGFYPRWDVQVADDEVSLRPSVVVRDEPCRSHFVLHRNRVQWVDAWRWRRRAWARV
jgi:hypothetical protein